MPNKQYIKGVRKERQIVNEARANGLISFRSAGSHSPIDVVTIDLMQRKIKFIQCKPDNMSSNKKFLLEQEMKELHGNFEVDFEVR